jgi:hypothetical protein
MTIEAVRQHKAKTTAPAHAAKADTANLFDVATASPTTKPPTMKSR